MTVRESLDFVEILKKGINTVKPSVSVMIAPPFTALYSVKQILSGSIIKLGAQNINNNEKGAYTGEISANMLSEIGVDFVIVGHSERRHIYGENDELINQKITTSLNKGFKTILCVGETLEERESGKAFDVIERQLNLGLKNIGKPLLENLIIAYEPVWAIGTGKTATPEIAQEIHAFIRNRFAELFSKGDADKLIIQYGGSVKDDNVDKLMSMPDINGALVGGAALVAESFIRIVNFKE